MAFKLIDTDAFDRAIAKREEFLTRYDQINQDYQNIIEELLENWEGKGADAFRTDSQEVRTNLTGIYDVLKTMCDMLEDCRTVFGEVDTALGQYNSNPDGAS